MKAIQEMVDYLFGQSLLAREDLTRLDALGLLAGTAAEGFAQDDAPAVPMAEALAEPVSEREDWLESAEAAIERRALRRRRASAPKPLTHVVAGPVLSDRILDCLAENEGDLAGLQRLAATLGPARNRVSAVRTLLAAQDAALEQAVAAVLVRRGGLLDLWDAATVHDDRSLLQKGEHGPAAVAYLAIAGGAGPRELGRYAAALAEPGFAELMQLVRAQRRILRSIGRRLKADPASFDRPLFVGAKDSDCYWTLTLAISAQQAETPAATAIVLEPPACGYLGPHAGQCAVLAKALAMTGLPVEALASWQDDWTTLRCPPAWNLGIAYFYKAPENPNRGAP